MECFPPCAACTGLCKEPVRAAPASKARAARSVAPNMADPVRLVCGCLADIMPLVRLFTKDVWCDAHGWSPIASERKPRKRKTRAEVPGQEEIIPY